jgi:hypothetical protein
VQSKVAEGLIDSADRMWKGRLQKAHDKSIVRMKARHESEVNVRLNW